MDYYRGKKVFVTGGSSGIGLATARYLSRWGASVYLAARGVERLDAALAEVRAEAADAGQVFGRVVMDVSDRAVVEAAAPDVLEALGGLDVLVHSAGILYPATVIETPDDVFELLIRVNYLGTVHVTRAFLPHFYRQRSGHIAVVASLLGFMGIYGYAAYAASKFAMIGFVDSLRQELLDYGVTISILFPPDTDTPALRKENEIKPPETKAIAGGVKVMTADKVALALLRGIARRRYHIVPGAMSQWTYFAYRHAPWFVDWSIDRTLLRYRREHPESAPTAKDPTP